VPIYQYKCDECSCDFDIRKSFNDDADHVNCPDCGKKATRVFIPPAIIFKGSGFYVTDYKANATIPSPKPESMESKAGKAFRDVAEVVSPKKKKATEIQ
jgi:putative FmdB family regulatory protein